MSGEHQLMYWSLSFKRVELRFLSGHPGVDEDYLWNSVNHTSITYSFYYTVSSVHSNNQEDPRAWEKLITSFSAQLKVMLEPNEVPELDDEWLIEGEALAQDVKWCQEALRDTGAPSSQHGEVTITDSSLPIEIERI
eukprot:12540414-Ditylum_brightwellii.AAC.1